MNTIRFACLATALSPIDHPLGFVSGILTLVGRRRTRYSGKRDSLLLLFYVIFINYPK
jgi:hypothetical protein